MADQHDDQPAHVVNQPCDGGNLALMALHPRNTGQNTAAQSDFPRVLEVVVEMFKRRDFFCDDVFGVPDADKLHKRLYAYAASRLFKRLIVPFRPAAEGISQVKQIRTETGVLLCEPKQGFIVRLGFGRSEQETINIPGHGRKPVNEICNFALQVLLRFHYMPFQSRNARIYRYRPAAVSHGSYTGTFYDSDGPEQGERGRRHILNQNTASGCNERSASLRKPLSGGEGGTEQGLQR